MSARRIVIRLAPARATILDSKDGPGAQQGLEPREFDLWMRVLRGLGIFPGAPGDSQGTAVATKAASAMSPDLTEGDGHGSRESQ
jgi:hypothetical protein